MTRNARPRDGDDGMTAAIAADLHSIAIRLLRAVRPVDAQAGLSAARLSALSVLVFGGSRTIGELAEAEQVTPPTMTRLVSALEAEGYVRRARDSKDGRVVRVSATSAGRRVLEAGRRRRVERITALLADATPVELQRLREATAVLDRVLS